MATLRYDRLPIGLAGAMQRYIENRIPPGHFLTAVLSNDLSEACGRADDDNRHRLFEIVSWVYNEAPSACWGSPQRVAEWLRAREAEAA